MTLKPRKILLALALAAAAAGTSVVSTAQAGTLAVNIAFKGASQRAVWQSIIDDFKKAHPGTDVKVSFVDEEAYKVQLPGWLSTVAPDIVNWHDGERMAYYAQRGLFEDLSGDWAKNGWNECMRRRRKRRRIKASSTPRRTVYYSWGMFYRKDLFEKVGISGEPKTWDQFLDDCKKLKAAGITPIAVAGRDAWTLAGWFDYLDLRLNGNAFHQKLMAGEIAYTDPRVKKVYTTWKQLLDAGLLHRQLAVLRSRFRAAVPVPGQGGDDADGHLHHGGFSAERETGDGLLPVPDHRREGADRRRRSGRITAYSVESEEQGGCARFPRVRRDAGEWREARGGSRLAVGEQQVA